MRILGLVIGCAAVITGCSRGSYYQAAHQTPIVGVRVPGDRSVTDRLEREAKPSYDALRRARRLLEAGDVAAAEAECRQAVQLSRRIGSSTGGVPTNAGAAQLLGEIYLREGKNREALQMFLPRLPYDVGGGLNVNIAITYCRLGDYQRAKRFYSDQALVKMMPGVSPLDRPGSRSLASLEASALIARGADASAERRYRDALLDFLTAERLVPRNPLVAYSLARQFLRSDDGEQALPRCRLAASAGHGRIAAQMKKKLQGLTAWFYWHPTPRVKVEMIGNRLTFTRG